VMNDDGTGAALAVDQSITGDYAAIPSGKTYGAPAARRWLYITAVGIIPNTTRNYGELGYFTVDATGQATFVPITNFASSNVYIPTTSTQDINEEAFNWSNDGQDSFVSFVVIDANSNAERQVRLNITGDNLPTATNPYTVLPSDPSVQTVLRYPWTSATNFRTSSWRGDGTRLAYILWSNNTPQLRIKDVGPPGTDDTTMADALLLIPADINAPRWSPTADTLCCYSNGTDPVLYTIGTAPGSTLKTILTGSNVGYLRPHWSPDGANLGFNSDAFKPPNYLRGPFSYQIDRLPAGGGKGVKLTTLTSGFDPYAPKGVVAWRP
jgi:hypothetical protein